MSEGIFISYRRDDTRQAAGRLADDLTEQFGADRIFRDIERIELGVDFEQALNKALNGCEVMLVLIGQRWSSITDAQDRRRLEQPGDWIRIEIVTALRRNIRVVPVLVDGAAMPAESDLPDDLKPLLRRQAFALEDGRWKSDVQRLTDALSRMEGLATARRPAAVSIPAAEGRAATAPVPAPAGGGRRNLLVGVAVGVVLVIGAIVLIPGGSEPADAAPLQAAQAPAPAPDVVGRWAGDGLELEVSRSGEALWVRSVHKGYETEKREGTLADGSFGFAIAFDPEMACELTLSKTGQSLAGSCTSGGKNESLTLARQ